MARNAIVPSPFGRAPDTPPRAPRGAITRRALLEGALGAGIAAGLAALPFSIGCTSGRRDRPNILLITLDTTRPDRLGCYGHPGGTTPALDRLAGDSVIFTRAYSTSSWTLPAHASLFTGKLPTSHGAQFDPRGSLTLSSAIQGHPDWPKLRVSTVSPRERLLATRLKEQGYATGGVVAGPWLKRVFALDRGFDHYDDADISTENGRRAASVTGSALRWIEEVLDRPFFLFLNYYDPHWPYAAPHALERAFLPGPSAVQGPPPARPEWVRMYDAEIRYMDEYLGKLLDGLRRLDLYDRTWILITSDHGELLDDHGRWGHGQTLTQEELLVPLLLKYPRGEMPPAREDVPAQITDLFPLICRRLGLSPPGKIQGEATPRAGRAIIAEVNPLPALSPRGRWRAMIEGDFKYLWSSLGHHELYNLREDPREFRNLLDREPERARRMESSLTRLLASLPRPEGGAAARAVDPQTEKALKSLGYLGE